MKNALVVLAFSMFMFAGCTVHYVEPEVVYYPETRPGAAVVTVTPPVRVHIRPPVRVYRHRHPRVRVRLKCAVYMHGRCHRYHYFR